MGAVTGQQPGGAVHAARPGRAARVIGDLAELRGPVRGAVELPVRLFWAPDRTFDLDDPVELRWMYENVLREAIRGDELRRWLDGNTLVRLWPTLNLPRGVRRAWESRHAQLRRAT
ncbi:hypothetical protein [Polymorphospora rubra]|uniref:hypothetical protein n=1 Tax=Polymorphospora rubra TaxID=338584 RepID=UPI0033F86F16